MSDLDRSIGWLSPRERERVDEETKAKFRKKELLHYLWNMGVERYGIAVGDKEAMESVLDLKKQFDFETNSFT